MNRRRAKDYEKEYKTKFDTVEQTREIFVDGQAKLDGTLAEIKKRL